ncbi:hypothetical protein Btru_049460 [Bulinus truncatus]|nr:hypothetical protein Btru_049460 [Bulinus truncatus]
MTCLTVFIGLHHCNYGYITREHIKGQTFNHLRDNINNGEDFPRTQNVRDEKAALLPTDKTKTDKVSMLKHHQPIGFASCQLINNIYMNCSFRNFTEVPNIASGGTITTLDLSNNRIFKLKNSSFADVPNLTKMDVSRNSIKFIEVNAFVGLCKLLQLNISHNNLEMKFSTFLPDVFKPLKSLELLIMNKNTEFTSLNNSDLDYPHEALSGLKSLTELHIDGLYNKSFGIGLRAVVSLRHLLLSGFDGNCNLTSLRHSTFVNVPYLETLDIGSCCIKGQNIEPNVFSPLDSLVSLNVTHNENIGLNYLNNLLYSLHEKKSLKKLYIRLIINRYSLAVCLEQSHIRYFPKYLEYLDAQENNLQAIGTGVLGGLPPTLKILNLSGNKFVFGMYLSDLYKMVNLEELYLSQGMYIYNIPIFYPYDFTNSLTKDNCSNYRKPITNEYQAFVLKLPPKLRKIELNGTGLVYKLTELNASENILETLILRNNRFPSLDGPFYGFENVKYLDLARNSIISINVNFFEKFPSLTKLILFNNNLGDFFATEGLETLVFSKLYHLEYLDLTNNNLRCFHVDIFIHLYHLKFLYLSNNLLTSFVANITGLHKLHLLDLSRTKVSSIIPELKNVIDTFKHIQINMSSCEILCECSNIDFLRWMISSKVFNKTFDNYKCLLHDSSIELIDDGYTSTMERLDHKCTPHVVLFIWVGMGSLVLCCIVLAGIAYRFRWRIRYLYYAAYLYHKSNRKMNSVDFKFDVFISYDHADEEEVLKVCKELEARSLKLCVHGRDFNAGEYISSNIVNAVCSSRKTLVVLTQNMLSSYWCNYEIQIANMESIHTGRAVLIFLMMEQISDNIVSRELLYLICNNTYVNYPKDVTSVSNRNLFWDKFLLVIFNLKKFI